MKRTKYSIAEFSDEIGKRRKKKKARGYKEFRGRFRREMKKRLTREKF